MISHFPVIEPLNKDTDFILNALSMRSDQIKSHHDSQSVLKKIIKICKIKSDRSIIVY